MEVLKERDFYSEDFETVQREGKGEPRWFQDYRRTGMETFLELGFPTRKQEEWRFSDFRSLARTEFSPSLSANGSFSAEDLEQLPFSELQCPRIVFVNGAVRPDLSRFEERAGLTVTTLRSALRNSPEAVEAHLGKHAGLEDNPFVALNAALSRDGFFIHVNPGTTETLPVHVLHVTTDSSRPVRTHLRNLAVVGENSQFTLVECYLGAGGNVAFTNPITEVVVGANSMVRHYRLQNESRRGFHVGCNEVYQDRDSHYRTLSIDLGSRLTRNNFRCVLDGEGSLAGIDGLYLLKDRQHLDNYTTLEHVKPHCDSRELFKGVLDDRARGIFRGRIIVHEDAQKTDSKQTNNNLLLSDHSLVNTKPQLEIYADDVKCTHGATIGQLDREALFYLRSRGIPRAAAHSILIYAFASEVIERIQVSSLRDQLVEYLIGWLPQGKLVRGVYEG